MTTAIKEHCNRCMQETNCDILYQKRTDYHESDTRLWGYNTYQIIQCKGCDSFFFREESLFSADTDEAGEPIVRAKIYPPKVTRKEPEVLYKYLFNGCIDLRDKPYRKLFREIYIAIGNEAPSLAAMGIRSLIERMMVDSIGDKGSFKKNLSEFEKQGYISKNQASALKKVIEIGHAAMHRKYRPNLEELHLALDIVEIIYELTFYSDMKATRASCKVPKRK